MTDLILFHPDSCALHVIKQSIRFDALQAAWYSEWPDTGNYANRWTSGILIIQINLSFTIIKSNSEF